MRRNRSGIKEWKPILLKSKTLCNGDYDRAIRIEIFDDRFNGQHKLIGQCFTSVSKLLKGPGVENCYEVCMKCLIILIEIQMI